MAHSSLTRWMSWFFWLSAQSEHSMHCLSGRATLEPAMLPDFTSPPVTGLSLSPYKEDHKASRRSWPSGSLQTPSRNEEDAYYHWPPPAYGLDNATPPPSLCFHNSTVVKVTQIPFSPSSGVTWMHGPQFRHFGFPTHQPDFKFTDTLLICQWNVWILMVVAVHS